MDLPALDAVAFRLLPVERLLRVAMRYLLDEPARIVRLATVGGSAKSAGGLYDHSWWTAPSTLRL
jgi:hypothetical protein